ncbi:hypothetical protein GOV12_03570 [Candidatus Pacearchaeota archaeon]|nr:hypothetical protein [Candidatus Pacearchaeota archaeon]
MEKNKKTDKIEQEKVEVKKTEKVEEKKIVETKEKSVDKKEPEKKVETKEKIEEKPKTEEKKKDNKKPVKIVKKTDATVNGKDLHIGRKHAVAICNFIRNKNIDDAINLLNEVLKYKRAIPMRGEIPHRKGMMSGRYPIKGTGIYLKLLLSLKSNAIANDLELEKFKLYAMANVAARPHKRFGSGRFKRTHVLLKLISKQKVKKQIKEIK